MPAQSVSTLKFDCIVAESQSGNIQCCNTYGIFKHKLVKKEETWILSDETKREFHVKLCPPLEDYPIPIAGDIVRIHRLGFDRNTKSPAILSGKNVVIWRGFRRDPVPITKAKSPTYTELDTNRRKELEIYFESSLMPVNMIVRQQYRMATGFNVAGRILEISTDRWDNPLFKFSDGTGTFTLRVFPKKNENEDNFHYEVAKRLVVGDLIVATYVTLDKTTKEMVNLSANTRDGRSISKIEPDSYLGRKLTLAIEAAPENISNPPQTTRRSPRLRAQVAAKDDSPIPAKKKDKKKEEIPEYTRLSDIPVIPYPKYEFYDLAGQVRGAPNETSSFNNWVFQLYDGSCPEYECYHAHEVKEKEPDCATIFLYSVQAPQDTDVHIEKVKKLNPGDLVFVKNVKAQWKDGKLKLEMNANEHFGKSISVIDKSTKFGEMLDDIVSNIISTQETSCI